MSSTSTDVADLLAQTAALKTQFNTLVQTQKELPVKLLADWIDAKAKINKIYDALVAQGWIKP